MGVDARHPLYDAFLPDWQQLRDCYEGERTIKAAGTKYLPATSGMIADGLDQATSKGYLAFAAYRTRAVFPEFVKAAVEKMIGIMHMKPPTIAVPAEMEPMLECATLRKESAEMLLRRINEQQLLVGRVGMLLDVIPAQAGAPGAKLPYIALYEAESVINWGETVSADGMSLDKLNLVVLDESGPERTTDGFGWVDKTRYRVLVLGNPTLPEPVDANTPFRAAVFDSDNLEYLDDSPNLVTPSIAGKTLNEIPFVVANSKDIVPEPDEAPLVGLSNIALTVYRGEADYRQALFMQGQDTLVVTGGEEDKVWRTGANAAITPPIGGDAKYIGVQSAGLSEMREALQNDHVRADQKSGELVSETSREAESGEALKTRVAARTATLKQIALSGAAALQEILRIAARWIGADPEKVIVTPNLDFVDQAMLGAELVDLMSAKGLGAPLSLATIHEHMQRRGMTEKTWDEEMESIEDEKALELVPPTTTEEDGPAPDAGKPPVKKTTTQRTGFAATQKPGAKKKTATKPPAK